MFFTLSLPQLLSRSRLPTHPPSSSPRRVLSYTSATLRVTFLSVQTCQSFPINARSRADRVRLRCFRRRHEGAVRVVRWTATVFLLFTVFLRSLYELQFSSGTFVDPRTLLFYYHFTFIFAAAAAVIMKTSQRPLFVSTCLIYVLLSRKGSS